MAVDFYSSLAEAGLVELLKDELPALFPNGEKQVTASDDTILDNGNDYYAIAYPGNFPVIDTASSFRVYDWEIQLDILARWKTNHAAAWAAFKALRSEVVYLINHTETGRSLGKTNYVRSAMIAAEDRPRYIPVRGTDENNPTFSHIGQVCIVTVTMTVPRS